MRLLGRRTLTSRHRSAGAVVRGALWWIGVLLVLPAVASAQAPQPVAPADGYQHAAGSPPPTFTFAPGSGSTDYLWVHVSKSPTTEAGGVIGSDVTLASFSTAAPTWTPTAYTFPTYWLVTPRTYYWQPFRISFTDDPNGYQEGAIRRFEVRAAPPVPPPPTSPPPPTTGVDYFAGLSTELIPSYVGLRAPWIPVQRKQRRHARERGRRPLDSNRQAVGIPLGNETDRDDLRSALQW